MWQMALFANPSRRLHVGTSRIDDSPPAPPACAPRHSIQNRHLVRPLNRSWRGATAILHLCSTTSYIVRRRRTRSRNRSRGAEAYRFGHVSRAARCLLACWRLAKTPASSPCLPAAAGVRAGPPGSAKLSAGLRPRRRRQASMARRSTGACPVCSGHAVQHRQLSGRVYRARAGRLGRDSALNSTTTPALRSGRRQRACAARRSTAGCSPPFQQHLLSRFSRCDRIRGPAPTASLRQRCL